MATRQSPDDELSRRIVDMYVRRVPLAEITAQTSVPRASIYLVLKKAGIRPDRVASSVLADSPNDLLDRLSRLERENGRLRERLDEAEKRALFYQYIAMLLDQIGMAPPPGTRSWTPDFTDNEPEPAEPTVIAIELKPQTSKTQPSRPRRVAKRA